MKRRWNFSVGVFIVAVMFFVGLFLNFYTQKTGSGNFSSHEQKQTAADLSNRVQNIKSMFSDRTLLVSDECSVKLGKIYDDLNSIKIDQFSLTDLKANAPKLIQEFFDLRVFIRESLQTGFFESAKITEPCAVAHRRLFRGMRVLEDYLGMLAENVLFAPGLSVRTDETFNRVFKGSSLNFAWNEKYKPTDPTRYEPKSGDVLLSRGSASVSAAIARITNEDSNFSHAGIVWVDPVTKKVETVEAHIEFGTVVADIADYADMKVRSVVFRLNDPSLSNEENEQAAHEAATKVRDEVLKYKKLYGKSRYPNPCYDFGMKIDNPTDIKPSNDAKNRKCLFCSEVVSLAYSLLTKKKYNLPQYKSFIAPKNRKFLEDIGVEVNETFAPADMEIEPYFDLVLEWRDFIRVHKTHLMDAILSGMYAWMDDYNYQFYVPLTGRIGTDVAYIGRRVPFVDTFLDDKFPLNMGKDALNTMYMLDKVSNQLYAFLEDGEKANKVSYTPAQMTNALNTWRARDLADYEKGGNYNSGKDPAKAHRFHHLLRQKKEVKTK